MAKEACIPVTLFYLGQILLEEKCPNWICSHVPSPYFHQQSLKFPLLFRGLMGPLRQHFALSGVFSIHPEYLESAQLLLSSCSVFRFSLA